MVSESPCYFCAECFGRLHYTSNHSLIENSKFKVYAYKFGKPLPLTSEFFNTQRRYQEGEDELEEINEQNEQHQEIHNEQQENQINN
jgi:hypothetical protein